MLKDPKKRLGGPECGLKDPKKSLGGTERGILFRRPSLQWEGLTPVRRLSQKKTSFVSFTLTDITSNVF